jgi:hypothetical protein
MCSSGRCKGHGQGLEVLVSRHAGAMALNMLARRILLRLLDNLASHLPNACCPGGETMTPTTLSATCVPSSWTTPPTTCPSTHHPLVRAGPHCTPVVHMLVCRDILLLARAFLSIEAMLYQMFCHRLHDRHRPVLQPALRLWQLVPWCQGTHHPGELGGVGNVTQCVHAADANVLQLVGFPQLSIKPLTPCDFCDGGPPTLL